MLPVIDENGRLVGELAALDILKRFIPEYIFRMDNLDFLNSFEPFNKIFEAESHQMIQFTVKMVKQQVRACFVVDNDQHYQGTVLVKDIVKKVLRG